MKNALVRVNSNTPPMVLKIKYFLRIYKYFLFLKQKSSKSKQAKALF